MSSLSPPADLLIQILTRMPVENLLRFRCVCKRWCDLIDSSYFIKRHINRSIATHSNLFLINTIEGTPHSLDYDSLAEVDEIEIGREVVEVEVASDDLKRPRFLDTCNGLLLLQTAPKLFLYNPSTREELVLPNVSDIDEPLGDLHLVYEYFRLGYDSINDDFKIFNILSYKRFGIYKEFPKARVFSLKSNLWGPIRDFDSCEVKWGSLWGSCVNDSLHQEMRTPRVEDHCIVAYNIRGEGLKFFPAPDGFLRPRTRCRYLTVFEGCLCAVGTYRDANDEFKESSAWVMKKYGMNEWTLLFSVRTSLSTILVKPLWYSKSRNEVLLHDEMNDGRRLVWYDLTTQQEREVVIHGGRYNNPHVCVGSLFKLRSHVRRRSEEMNMGRDYTGSMDDFLRAKLNSSQLDVEDG